MHARSIAFWSRKPLRLAAGLVMAASCAFAAVPGQEGSGLPRYRFKVGVELVYELTRQQDFRDSARAAGEVAEKARDKMEWRVIVVDENDDGSWRLLIRTKITFVNNDGSVRARRHSLGYCDFHPNGSYQFDERTAVVKRLLPHELFCRLPDTAAESASGWSYQVPVMDYAYRFQVERRKGASSQLRGVEKAIYGGVHGWETEVLYDFDAERGLVTAITRESKNAGAESLRDRRVVELTKVEQHDAGWVASFRKESQRYLDDYAAWLALSYEAERARTAAARQAARTQAKAVLETGRAQAESELVRETYNANLREHEEGETWVEALANKREQFFDAAPGFDADWETTALDGATFRLADRHGKPVVLFFWGTNCEYCVMMGAQLNRLVAELEDEGVGLFGMFVLREGVSREQEMTQAKTFVERAYRGFKHLDGTAIEKMYRLEEFGLGHPLLLILDQAGKPYEVQMGYTADIESRVRQVLGELAAKGNKASR